MANVILTLRDIDLFAAVERCPLTVRQLRALSVTFRSSFGSDRRLQDRVAILTEAGLLNRFRYAAAEVAGQYYYTLTPESYRLLHGQDEPLPSLGIFREAGIARHNHMRMLAEFIVQTFVAAHRDNVQVESFHRENALKLTVADEHLYPDCAFTLRIPARPAFTFYVELDNSTEPLASLRERDSWVRKLQFYEKLQDASVSRFRVLGVFTKSTKRLDNLQMLACAQTHNPQRSLFYGVYLPDYLEHASPLFADMFVDHRGLRIALLPRIMPLPTLANSLIENSLPQAVTV